MRFEQGGVPFGSSGGNYASVPGITLGKTVTLEGRVRVWRTSIGSIGSWGGGGSDVLNFHPNYSGTWYFDFGRTSTGGRMTGAVPTDWLGREVHFACVADRDSGRMAVYADGVLIGSQTSTPGFAAPLFLTPGQLGAGFGGDLEGHVRDVRIWTVARTEEQIRRGMAEGITGREEGLLAWYPLDQDVKDYAAKGRPGPQLVDSFETPYATKALLDTGQAWLSAADALTPSPMPVAGGRAIFGPTTYVERGVAVPSSNMRVAFTLAAENTPGGHIAWVTPRWFSAASMVQIQIGATQVALGAVTFPAAIKVGGRYEAEIVGRVAVLRLDGVEIGRWTSAAWPLLGTRVYVGASQSTGFALEDFVATPLELPALDGTPVGGARPQLALR